MQAKVPAVQVAQKPIEIPPVVVRHQRPMVIDDVAQGAQKYRGEDKVDKAKIDAKNCWENHCVNARNTHAEEKLEVKFGAGDKEQAVQDALERLVKNELGEKEDQAVAASNNQPSRQCKREEAERVRKGEKGEEERRMERRGWRSPRKEEQEC